MCILKSCCCFLFHSLHLISMKYISNLGWIPLALFFLSAFNKRAWFFFSLSSRFALSYIQCSIHLARSMFFICCAVEYRSMQNDVFQQFSTPHSRANSHIILAWKKKHFKLARQFQNDTNWLIAIIQVIYSLVFQMYKFFCSVFSISTVRATSIE